MCGSERPAPPPPPILVEQTEPRLLFRSASQWPSSHGTAQPRIGIPRALTTHSLHPLYATFFSALGMEVVLSGVDPRGELKVECRLLLPGADRARRGVGPRAARAESGFPAACAAHAAGQRRAGIPTSARSPRPDPIFWRRRFPKSASFRRCWISPMATRPVRRSWKWPCGIWECRAGWPNRRGRAAVRAQTEAESALRQLGQTGPGAGGGGRKTGDPARRPQLQRVHAGGFAIGGQETVQHGRHGHPGGLPRAGGDRARPRGTSRTKSSMPWRSPASTRICFCSA